MQITSPQSRISLLCGFIIILSLLQSSGANNNCFSLLSMCSSLTKVADLQFPFNHSEVCTSLPTDVLGDYGLQHALTNFSYVSAIAYVFVDLAPLMVYFPLLILFNLNLASGPAQSFVFFYQMLPAATAIPIDTTSRVIFDTIGGGVIWGLLTMQSPINDLIFPRVLPFITLQYCKLALAAVLVVLTLGLVKCIACPCASWRRPWAKFRRSVRHFRERHAQRGTVLDGLCSIAILTYGFVTQQSLSVLQPANCCPSSNEQCLFYCSELGSITGCNGPFIFSALISLVLVLPLPLLLLYYPCVPALMQRITKRSSPLITCHKLAPVFDVFQSAYKPKLRFFAAFPLLYRLIIWFLFSFLSHEKTSLFIITINRQYIIAVVFILILTIHSLVQPYSKPRHNYIETLYLVNLVLISVMFQPSAVLASISSTSYAYDSILLVVMLSVLLAIPPILVGIGYFLWKCNRSKNCRAVCCKRVKQNTQESRQEEDETRQEAEEQPSEAYLDLDEVASMEHTNS